jgi:hypothetical protein
LDDIQVVVEVERQLPSLGRARPTKRSASEMDNVNEASREAMLPIKVKPEDTGETNINTKVIAVTRSGRSVKPPGAWWAVNPADSQIPGPNAGFKVSWRKVAKVGTILPVKKKKYPLTQSENPRNIAH